MTNSSLDIPQRQSGEGESSARRQSLLTDRDAITTVFEALNDPDARTILEAVSEEPLSAMEISRDCDLPSSTTYRKVNQLTQAELLSEQVKIKQDGKHTSLYELQIEEIQTTITDDGIELELCCRETE